MNKASHLADRLNLSESAHPFHRDSNGNTSLHRYAQAGDVEMVRLLVSEGAEIDARNCRETPLFLAIHEGHVETVKLLLEAGADPDLMNGISHPMTVALGKGEPEIINLLVRAGVYRICDDFYGNPIHFAFLCHHLGETSQALLPEEACGPERNQPGLARAAFDGDIGKVACRLADSADVDDFLDYGLTLLGAAILGEQQEMLHFLIGQGVDVDLKCRFGHSPLELAIETSNAQTLTALLSAGARIHDESRLCYRAIERGNPEVLAALLAVRIDINQTYCGKPPPVFKAAKSGPVAMVRQLVDAGAVPELSVPEKEFWLDVLAGDLKAVQDRLAEGLSLHTIRPSGCSLLLWAIVRGHADVAACLIRAGVDCNDGADKASQIYNTPLKGAIEIGNPDLVGLLIDHGAQTDLRAIGHSLNWPQKEHIDAVKQEIIVSRLSAAGAGWCTAELPLAEHHSLLAWAIKHGHDILARQFINATIANAPCINGERPLVLAAKVGNETLVRWLLDLDDQIVLSGILSPRTLALHAAIAAGHEKIARILIAHGAQLNAGDSDGITRGITPLHRAAVNGCGIKPLLRAGVEVNARDSNGLTPLHWARTAESARLLLAAGANVQAKSDKGWQPLHSAATTGNLELVEWLLAQGADLNARTNPPPSVNDDSLTKEGFLSALDLAVLDGHGQLARILLAAGASFDASSRTSCGFSILQDTVFQGEKALLRLMLENGVLPTESPPPGECSALHLCCMKHGHEKIARLLIEAGAEVDAPAPHQTPWLPDAGSTALHWACYKPVQPGLLRLLLDSGANRNARDQLGQTPLHFAAAHADTLSLSILLDAGADIFATDAKGRTPLHFAAAEGNNAAIRCLLRRGAPINALDFSGNTPLEMAAAEERRGACRIMEELRN